jgi:hypothetical protein
MASISAANDRFATDGFAVGAENPLLSAVGKTSESIEDADLIDVLSRQISQKMYFRCFLHCSQGKHHAAGGARCWSETRKSVRVPGDRATDNQREVS